MAAEDVIEHGLSPSPAERRLRWLCACGQEITRLNYANPRGWSRGTQAAATAPAPDADTALL